MLGNRPAQAVLAGVLGFAAVAVSVPMYGQTVPRTGSMGAVGDAHDASIYPTRDYVGSEACQQCHEPAYKAWRSSLHVRMTRPVGEAFVAGDFSDGTEFEDHGRAYRMETRDGRYFISVSHYDRPFEKHEVLYTLGARRFQGYLSRMPDGRLWVMPAFWHVPSQRWVDYEEITPLPDGEHDMRQFWNVQCFNCHATNLVKNFDIESKTYDTTWTEMGLGCEACHGPGKAHVELMTAWEEDPASKPVYDASDANRELSSILRTFSYRTADARQSFDTCAYCHGNKTNYFLGFAPGDRAEDYALPFLISEDMPAEDQQGEFWPDGRPSRFNRPQALTLSGCFMKGQVTCTSCHVAHGSENEHALKVPLADSNTLCTQCHKTFTPPTPGMAVSLGGASSRSFEGPELVEHTHHPVDSVGSRCVECHMSDVNWRLLNRRRDHTFAPPVPELTARYGVPNACTTCHDNRSPEWAASTMDRWYGDKARRQNALQLSDTIYRAASGDRTVVTELAQLGLDRSKGILLRASAARFLGKLYGPVESDASTVTQRSSPIVNALYGMASDAEPTVRAAAVTALGRIGDLKAISPLIARLVDSSRVVRSLAVASLLSLGIVSLPGAAGDVLAERQDEYTTFLRTFDDKADDHAALAWFEMLRGRMPEAEREASIAIALDANNPRPRVIRGVVAAQTGRVEEALRDWREARRLDPTYPKIDTLISEAEKRLSAFP